MLMEKQNVDLEDPLLNAVDDIMTEAMNKGIHDAEKVGELAQKHLENNNVVIQGSGNEQPPEHYTIVTMHEQLKALDIAQDVYNHKLE